MNSALKPEAGANFDVIAAVRDATAQAGKRKKAGEFSLAQASPGEAITAVIFGLYLAYAVARLPSIFPFMEVPKLPMFLMASFLVILGVTVPPDRWKAFWLKSIPLRLMTLIGVLAVITVPLGIWISGSFDYLIHRYVISLAVFYCTFIFLRDRANLRRAVAVYVFCLGAVSVYSVANFTPPPVQYDSEGYPIETNAEKARIYVGDSLDPNDFGAVLAVALPLALWLGVGGPLRRVFWSAIALVFVSAVVLTGSRGSLLGFGAVALVFLGIGARGWRRILTFILIGGGVMIFLAAAGTGQMDRMMDFGGDDYNVTSTEGRMHFWKQGMIWMIKRPWGSGLGNFATKMDYTHGSARVAHSAWVTYGMELGVAGLAAYVLLCAVLVKGLLQLRKRAILAGNREDEALAGHLVAMMTGLMVTGTFLSNGYNAITYMAVGIAAAALVGTKLPDPPTETIEPVINPGRLGRQNSYPAPHRH